MRFLKLKGILLPLIVSLVTVGPLFGATAQKYDLNSPECEILLQKSIGLSLKRRPITESLEVAPQLYGFTQEFPKISELVKKPLPEGAQNVMHAHVMARLNSINKKVPLADRFYIHKKLIEDGFFGKMSLSLNRLHISKYRVSLNPSSAQYPVGSKHLSRYLSLKKLPYFRPTYQDDSITLDRLLAFSHMQQDPTSSYTLRGQLYVGRTIYKVMQEVTIEHEDKPIGQFTFIVGDPYVEIKDYRPSDVNIFHGKLIEPYWVDEQDLMQWQDFFKWVEAVPERQEYARLLIGLAIPFFSNHMSTREYNYIKVGSPLSYPAHSFRTIMLNMENLIHFRARRKEADRIFKLASQEVAALGHAQLQTGDQLLQLDNNARFANARSISLVNPVEKVIATPVFQSATGGASSTFLLPLDFSIKDFRRFSNKTLMAANEFVQAQYQQVDRDQSFLYALKLELQELKDDIKLGEELDKQDIEEQFRRIKDEVLEELKQQIHHTDLSGKELIKSMQDFEAKAKIYIEKPEFGASEDTKKALKFEMQNLLRARNLFQQHHEKQMQTLREQLNKLKQLQSDFGAKGIGTSNR